MKAGCTPSCWRQREERAKIVAKKKREGSQVKAQVGIATGRDEANEAGKGKKEGQVNNQVGTAKGRARLANQAKTKMKVR